MWCHSFILQIPSVKITDFVYGNDDGHKCSGGVSIQKLNNGQNSVQLERWTKNQHGDYGDQDAFVILILKFGK